jgi:hypothetical protein
MAHPLMMLGTMPMSTLTGRGVNNFSLTFCPENKYAANIRLDRPIETESQ